MLPLVCKVLKKIWDWLEININLVGPGISGHDVSWF